MKMLKVSFGLLCVLGVVVSTPTKAKEDTRIVGGENIDISKIPYQVSLQIYGRHACGGALMTYDLVVSAAHCVVNSAASIFSVRAGSSSSTEGGQTRGVAEFKAHPEFTYAKMDYDISLLKLEQPFQPSANVVPIALAKPDDVIEPGTEVYISGWGRTSEGGSLPRNLQIVVVPTVSDEACQKAYAPQYQITNNMLCAGVQYGGKDACQGDSGGPLVFNNTLTGVVSWGVGCARPMYPGVYARVAPLRGWLEDTKDFFRAKDLLRSPHEDLFFDRISSLFTDRRL